MEQMPEEVVFNLENAFMTGKVKISKTGEILKRSIQKAWNCTGIMEPDKNLVWLSNRKRKRCKLYSKSEGRSVSPGWRDRSDLQSGRGCSVSGTKSVKTAKAEGDTDQDGSLVFEQMYLGTYELEEINIPEGYQKKKIRFRLCWQKPQMEVKQMSQKQRSRYTTNARKWRSG